MYSIICSVAEHPKKDLLIIVKDTMVSTKLPHKSFDPLVYGDIVCQQLQ